MRSGWNTLLISYRNDGEAPESVDRKYGLGGTEWADVVDAVRFAEEHGAREIVLMGWSMGGAIVLQAVLRSAEARERLVGVMLDSPAIDWVDILRFQGSALGLPRAIGDSVSQLLGGPFSGGLAGVAAPISLEELDPVVRADEFDVPILLMHSVDDGFVPIDGSRRFAASRPDLIEFEVFEGARHTKLWNHDPDALDGTHHGLAHATFAERSTPRRRGRDRRLSRPGTATRRRTRTALRRARATAAWCGRACPSCRGRAAATPLRRARATGGSRRGCRAPPAR